MSFPRGSYFTRIIQTLLLWSWVIQVKLMSFLKMEKFTVLFLIHKMIIKDFC